MYQSQAIQESCLAASGFPGKRSHFSAFRKQCHIGQDSPTIYRQGYIIGSDIHLLNLHSVFVRILSKDGHSRLNDICKNSRFEKKIYPTKFNSTYIKNSTADDNSNNSGSGDEWNKQQSLRQEPYRPPLWLPFAVQAGWLRCIWSLPYAVWRYASCSLRSRAAHSWSPQRPLKQGKAHTPQSNRKTPA